MSNYINRLIARSFNQIETIQPRLPAIFEPHISDALDFHKRDVDIDPTQDSSKEDEIISALSDSNKQILSNTVKKKIKTGKNDLKLHTSSRLQSHKSKDLTNTNETNPEMSQSSLNFINPDIEYPEKVKDTIIDENVSHDIFFKPDNNQTQNTDLLGPKNFIDQLNASRHTLLKPNESTSEQVSAIESDSQILNKLNDQPDSSNSTKDEINYIQQRNEVESNSTSHDNSNIENITQSVIINQIRSNQKNGLQESIPQESSFHPFKGKLVAQSRIRRNDNSPIDINDPSQQSVIRVNIGRIEVKAVQPPTPPPQPQSKQFKPILSLDDYLSKRNGG